MSVVSLNGGCKRPCITLSNIMIVRLCKVIALDMGPAVPARKKKKEIQENVFSAWEWVRVCRTQDRRATMKRRVEHEIRDILLNRGSPLHA